ncbi:MAG TPA: dethiobiotin synthase [Vicinamibacterales bacterium]|nr:dethiobiotin synthase [Vicinamibacterales bacterium]
MRDLLVTGTDTGVGKTVIAAALVTALRARGVRALGFKPAETGCSANEETDSDMLARASGERHALASPLLQLSEPLAPAVAADRAGEVLNPEDVESHIEQLRKAGYTLVIEGAGGVMVPIAWDYTVLDLAERCDLDAVVVGRPGLGTLNHVALTVLMLQSRHIPVRGIVLNGRGAVPDLAESTNPATLGRMLPGLRIVETPHQSRDVIAATATIVDRLL